MQRRKPSLVIVETYGNLDGVVPEACLRQLPEPYAEAAPRQGLDGFHGHAEARSDPFYQRVGGTCLWGLSQRVASMVAREDCYGTFKVAGGRDK